MNPQGVRAIFVNLVSRDLWAWVDEERGTVALMWSVNTGQVHQVDTEALYALISKLGGWI